MSGMCGIVDFAAPRIEPGVLRHMAESSAYRAPGGTAYRFMGPAGFAHQALQPPAGEACLEQPLLDPRSQACIVFDGRLDNRSELIGRLEPADGKAVSDAGLVLAAYLEWEEACTDHLLGDFAFAIWDAGRRRLLCAVDPLGLKPLHYARIGSLLVFASDAIQVLYHPAVPEGYNEGEIAAFLAGQVENPEQSYFTAVRKLGPGTRLIANPEGMRTDRYWQPRLGSIRYAQHDDYAAHFREIFDRAVDDRLRSDGLGVGIALSGGLDSSSVAAVAHRVSGASIHAYTFVFDQLTNCDERAWSRTMTLELGLEVTPLAIEHLWRLDSQIVPHWSPDTPFLGWHSCYEEVFRRMTERGSRVLLTGHGGDDLLRGSASSYAGRLWAGDLGSIQEVVRHAQIHHEPILRALYRHFGRPGLPAAVDRLLRRISGLDRDRNSLPAPWIQPGFTSRSRLTNRLEPLGSGRAFASLAQQEIHSNLIELPWYWRLGNWHDRTAAPWGIDVRHPFLDIRLIEYILAIPGEQTFQLSTTKPLLRRALAGMLPEKIRTRVGKTRFGPFLDSCLRKTAASEILDILESPHSAELGIVDGKRLKSSYLDFLDGANGGARRALWYAISLEIWLKRSEATLALRRNFSKRPAAA